MHSVESSNDVASINLQSHKRTRAETLVSLMATLWASWATEAPLLKNMRTEPWAARANCTRGFASRPITYMHAYICRIFATDSCIKVPGRAHNLYPPGHIAPSGPVKSTNLVDEQEACIEHRLLKKNVQALHDKPRPNMPQLGRVECGSIPRCLFWK